jgi:hypothetical protein
MFGFRSHSKSENDAVKARYKTIVEQRGELFEDRQESLTDADILDIEKRKRRLDARSWKAMAAATALAAFFFLIMDPTPDYVEAISFVAFYALIVFGLRYIARRHFDRALQSKKKRVVQGMISAKTLSDNHYFLHISYKVKIGVRKREYKNSKVGDILRIEMLADDIYINKKIVTLGKI